jgi:lipopolysaccharide transport system permease protein
VFVLCGLVPFNFFSLAWSTGTSSVADNAMIMKRVAVPRELIPVATVLGNCVHMIIQIALLLTFALAFGKGVNRYWLWLPFVWSMEVVFVCGLSMITSAVNVYIRDTRYVVESLNTVLFWLVPIFYDFSKIPPRYANLYAYNPIAALVMALRDILLHASAPPFSLLWKLCFGSFFILGVGVLAFRRMKTDFYDYL